MPGIIKVGQTQRHPFLRAAELSKASGVPVPFEVLFYVEVSDRFQAEQIIHSALEQYRILPDKEFFKISENDVKAIIYGHIAHLFVRSSASDPYKEKWK